MQKGIKFRIYPNREQKNFIHQTLGCCRFIYNRGLAMRKEGYENGEKIGYSQTSAMLTELKKQEEFAFLKAADSIALQQSLRDLDRGFVNFFQKRASYPTFKSKHNRFQSYRTVNQKDNIRIVGRYIKLPKLGYVKVRQSMEVGNIRHVTIEHTPSGKYFAGLTESFDAVCVEDLNLKGMAGGLHLGKGVHDNGYGLFLSMLEYKLEERGKYLIKADRYFASSKICSVCGKKKEELSLSDRIYYCECGNRMDRDVNAAVNIMKEGKRIFAECA